MTILHQLRRGALRVGLDVQRASTTAAARLVQLLQSRGVDLVLDVGANYGQYGKQLRYFGYCGDICSFEPLPRACTSLARHAARDPRWSVHQLALGAEDGTVSLNVAGNKGAASSSILPMLHRHEEAAPDARYVGAIVVPVRRLDTMWRELVPPGTNPFIKVDVQGFEAAVLNGAGRALDCVLGVQLEISLVPLYDGALSLREVLDRTERLGMDLVHVEPGFVDPRTGELLQMDGVFLRSTSP